MSQEHFAPGSLAALSSEALTSRLAQLLESGRRSLVEFLWLLAEIARRDIHLILGYPSLFQYCSDAVRLSNGSAFRRSNGAELLKRFPVAANFLSDGRLSLAKLILLRHVLTADNHLELFNRAVELREDDVRVLAASLRPRPETRDTIRRLSPPAADQAPAPAAEPAQAAPDTGVTVPPASLAPTVLPVLPVERPPRIEPINAERYSLTIHVGREFIEELRQVRAVLSHTVPSGKLEEVLRVCIQKTIESCGRRKHGAPVRAAVVTSTVELKACQTLTAEAAVTSTVELKACQTPAAEAAVTSTVEPKACQTPAVAAAVTSTVELNACQTPSAERMRGDREYVVVAERRAVWERDEGMCAWVGPDGKRCCSTHMLEFAHVVAVALGGGDTRNELRLLCKSHNQYEARRDFGAEFMSRFSRGARGDTSRDPP